MSQSLNIVPAFDGTNYGYWKARMQFFLKSIDCWSIVEIGWTKPADTTLKLVPKKNAQLSNDKALHALCQALSPFEFAKSQIVNLLKKRGKFWEQHIKAPNLLNMPNFKCLFPNLKKLRCWRTRHLESFTPR
jgi:hypothetical protein